MLSIALTVAAPLSAQSIEGGPFPCVDGATLAAYESSAPCLIGDKLEFFSFNFSASTTPGSVSTLDSDIIVHPQTLGFGGGFLFSGFGAATIGANQSATYNIGYSYVTVGDPPTVDASSIGMDPVTGSVGINQQLCPTGFDCFNNSISSLNPPSTLCDFGLSSPCWESTQNLPADITNGLVSNTITLTGSANAGAGFDDLAVSYDVIPSVPEPMNWILGLSGLAAIGLIRRYRYFG